MKKRVADIIVEELHSKGIEICYSVVGGGAMHLNNAFEQCDGIKMVYCHHEQACAMAAEGYAKACGKPAAVCVTSGPGGINALNGVQGAYVDSVPMVVISGHPRYETTVAATGLSLRCRGVQENDIIYMVQKMTKYAKVVTKPQECLYELEKAYAISMEGRRGPVWLDIPLDVQGALADVRELTHYNSEGCTVLDTEIEYLVDELKKSKRPCILTGSGIRTSNVREEFLKFAQKVRIPVVGGALQADVSYNEQERFFGMSGNMGPRSGNFILQNSDYILVLGNSLSFKQTGFNQKLFAPNAKIVMVDIDEDEALKPGIHVDWLIHMSLGMFFELYNKSGEDIDASNQWMNYCIKVKDAFPRYEMLERYGHVKDEERVPVLLFWKKFMKKCSEDVVLALGNSSCVHGILQEGVDKINQRAIVNYNSGSMGDDIPEAVGVKLACPNKEVFLITGDGSIMMNLQELQTVVHHNLAIKIIIFSNNGYGAIRTTCKNYFNGVYTGCDPESGISFPDFARISEAFRFPYKKCKNVAELDEAIAWINDQKSYCILEICERIDEIKGPKLDSKMGTDGIFTTSALHDMSPFLAQEEMDSLMWKEKV